MRSSIEARVRALERRRQPPTGALPRMVDVPSARGPARDAALSRVARLRAHGVTVFETIDGAWGDWIHKLV